MVDPTGWREGPWCAVSSRYSVTAAWERTREPPVPCPGFQGRACFRAGASPTPGVLRELRVGESICSPSLLLRRVQSVCVLNYHNPIVLSKGALPLMG